MRVEFYFLYLFIFLILSQNEILKFVMKKGFNHELDEKLKLEIGIIFKVVILLILIMSTSFILSDFNRTLEVNRYNNFCFERDIYHFMAKNATDIVERSRLDKMSSEAAYQAATLNEKLEKKEIRLKFHDDKCTCVKKDVNVGNGKSITLDSRSLENCSCWRETSDDDYYREDGLLPPLNLTRRIPLPGRSQEGVKPGNLGYPTLGLQPLLVA